MRAQSGGTWTNESGPLWTEDTAAAKAVSTGAPGLPAQGLALAGGVAGPIAAQAGLALRVGELHHGEHVQQPGIT